jgi:hypothetical protein
MNRTFSIDCNMTHVRQYILGYIGSERNYHTFNFLPDDEIISELDRNIDEESFLLKQSKSQYSKLEVEMHNNSPPRYKMLLMMLSSYFDISI